MITQIMQHHTKWTVYFVILQIMLKSPSKAKLAKNPYPRLLKLFKYNTDRFNNTYAVFQLRFTQTLVNQAAILSNFFTGWVRVESYYFR